MKNILLMCLLFVPFALSAQTSGFVNNKHKATKQEKRDRVENEKIAFITKELQLTTDEAQKFWPVYNQYSKERGELRKQRRESIQVTETMTDADAEKAVENMLSYRQKEIDLQRSYFTKFLDVIPGKKVAKLYNAEEKFKRMLLDRLNKKGTAKPQAGKAVLKNN